MDNNIFINSQEYEINIDLTERILESVFKDLEVKNENLIINFVNLETIISINSTHLDHNYETDIITFNYSENIKTIDAEIFISPDVAKDNANYYKCTLDEEILRLMIHGILHVTGYDDMNEIEKEKMKIKEDELVGKYNSSLEKESILL